jgi:hypothetical protein
MQFGPGLRRPAQSICTVGISPSLVLQLFHPQIIFRLSLGLHNNSIPAKSAGHVLITNLIKMMVCNNLLEVTVFKVLRRKHLDSWLGRIRNSDLTNTPTGPFVP